MSTRERPEKEKSSDRSTSTTSGESSAEKTSNNSTKSSNSADINDWLDSFDTSSKPATQQKEVVEPEVAQPQAPKEAVESTPPIAQEEEKKSVAVDTLLAEFIRQLPGWVNKPWMYVKPTHEGHLQNWFQSWRDLILKYTSIFSKHIINLYDIKELHPFTHQQNGKTLSLEQLQYLVESMIDENLAKWLDNDRLRARIYFTTDQEWADIIYQYMVDTGYVLDIMTFYELQNLDQEWSTLPDEELALVLDILVEEGKAEWVGKDRDTIQFKLQ